MTTPIYFFNKNKLDISNPNAILTASQAQAYVDFVRNRKNDSYWITTGSVDADLTNIVFDFVDERDVDFIMLVNHNFKAYTVQYWDGAAYVNFSQVIAETVNTTDTTFHSFTKVATTKLKLIIQGTMILNADKRMAQFIASTEIGQLNDYPEIKAPAFDRNLARTEMLSGKNSLIENIGGFTVTLDKANWKTAADLAIVETLFFINNGFLVWLCGNDIQQFGASSLRGYRLQDIFLMKCSNDYSPEYMKGLIEQGIGITLKLVEVVD